MMTKHITPILAGSMAWLSLGCSTMKVTTIASTDHPRDLGEPVLLRITFPEGPSVRGNGAFLSIENEAPSDRRGHPRGYPPMKI